MVRIIVSIFIVIVLSISYKSMSDHSHKVKIEYQQKYDNMLKSPSNKKEKTNKEIESLKKQLRGEVVTRYQQDVYFLAKTLYFEAQITNYDDRAAIAQVIMNRTKDRRFPNSVKGVVLQDKQFSCFNTIKGLPNLNSDVWAECITIAKLAIAGELEKTVGDAVFYHAPEVNPKWNRKMVKVKTIIHSFYMG